MLLLNKLKAMLLDGIRSLFHQHYVRKWLAACLFFILLTLILSVEFIPQRVDLVVGQVSPINVFASQNVIFQDKVKTEEARNLAANQVEQQYITDPQVNVDMQRNIVRLINGIDAVQTNSNLSEAEKTAQLQDEIPFELSQSVLAELAEPNISELELLKNSLTGLIAQAMEETAGITQQNTEDVEKTLIDKINSLQLSDAYKVLGSETVSYYLRPNKFFDQEKTQQLQTAAREAIQPITVTIKEKEKIIGIGEIVTEEHLAKIEALGMYHPFLPVYSILGSAMITALLMFVLLFYLYQQNRQIFDQTGYLYLLGIIVLGVLGVTKAFMAINTAPWPEFGALLAYLAPTAAAGMLVTILLDSRLATLTVAVISFLIGLITGGQINFALVAFVGGFTGIYGVSKLNQRGDMARAGFYVGAANTAAIFAMGLVDSLPIALLVSSSLILGAFNGILSSILTNGAIPYLESAFGITSSVRLMELSNPSSPLLRSLQTTAPGTYHHSLMVGNLAEAAADAVDGDAMLVRVAAYYHDIGKIKRPVFFIENQMAEENPHDRIAASLSTLILTAHVKDGVKMAGEQKLPKVIIDIIEQHHGLGMCSFFYQKARENGSSENINEDDYRYEGPKPQTKEAAIVLLADSVEAASRASQDHSQGWVEGLVHKIILDRLMDGQLEECDLTMRDLNIIAKAFNRVLSGMYHSRIEYPDMTKEIEQIEQRKVIPEHLGKLTDGKNTDQEVHRVRCQC